MTGTGFYFDPSARGTGIFLGPTEERLMQLVWKHGEITVRQALHEMSSDRNPAYTTIQTVLERLIGKDLMQRRKLGRVYAYRATMSEDEFLAERLRIVNSCLKDNFGTGS